MPIPTPFHPRTQPLCRSYRWKDWAGRLAVCRYESCHQVEYDALRHRCGAIDVSPLEKYEIRGRQAAAFLAALTVRDVTRLRPGRVSYTCWCDDRGYVVDDGTVACLDATHYRLTAALPSGRWMARLARRYDVEIETSTDRLACLALQGPTSRALLGSIVDVDLRRLRFFRVTEATVGTIRAWISRTGYTGDLGYEIWVAAEDALALWDLIFDVGPGYGLAPVGLDALDMARIEAGFIMLGVDYDSAPSQVRDARKSNPFELGLGWTVVLDRSPFIGQRALRRIAARGPERRLVGLVARWDELVELYDRFHLPPALPAEACRAPLPVYAGNRQVGYATSSTWSPLLKQQIYLASLRRDAATGSLPLEIEHTVERERHRVGVDIASLPFFNPERKKS